MTTQETIALVSAAIAALGVITTVFLYLHKMRKRKLANLASYLQPLLSELERTRLFVISPEDEIWEFGFETLSRLAELSAKAFVAADISSFASQNLRAALSQLNHHVKELRAFQDDWRIFCTGKDKKDWRSLQREWPGIQSATAALQAARPAVDHCKLGLSQFLGKHGLSA